MWLEADLHEIRVLLTLAEELHFGRTAERLGVTHARVSQIIGTLEARLGGRLFDRTSRTVRLTPLGAELASRLRPPYGQLLGALDAVGGTASEQTQELRIGVTLTTGAPVISRLVEGFEARHPDCRAIIEEVDTWDPYAALRSGDVDVLCNWLVVDERDISAGPVIEHRERVLAVGTKHRLASRESISIEDLAGETVMRPPESFPVALREALWPSRTPSGRPIPKLDSVYSTSQVHSMIARGQLVHPTVRGVSQFERDDMVLVPIHDMPPIPFGMMWSTAHESAGVRALAEIAARLDRLPVPPAENGGARRPRRPADRAAEALDAQLRPLGAFLTLTEELHFGRAADRFGVTPSRVSQLIRKLETSLGRRLFDRTSRRVRLTPAGARLRDGIDTPYHELERAFAVAREIATGIAGTLRIGMHSPVNGGPHMVRIIELFEERHPACDVSIIDIGLVRDQLETLRAGEVDLLATRLPISEQDVTIGSILSRETRLLAVSSQHPLARLESVDLEDIAPYAAADASGLPREMIDAFIPARTPSGRPIRRVSVSTMLEAIMRIALGEIVHPTVPSFLDHFQHPNLVGVPIRHLPATETALVWLTANGSMKIRAFARAARDVLANTELAPGRRPLRLEASAR
jgi:DNA-binding transcriptional LysR family regulator